MDPSGHQISKRARTTSEHGGTSRRSSSGAPQVPPPEIHEDIYRGTKFITRSTQINTRKVTKPKFLQISNFDSTPGLVCLEWARRAGLENFLKIKDTYQEALVYQF